MVHLLSQVDKLVLRESCSLGLERKVGGTSDPNLNTCLRSIVNKYHEGRMKRTLERELTVCEVVEENINQRERLVGLPCGVGEVVQLLLCSLLYVHGGSNILCWVASEELQSLCTLHAMQVLRRIEQDILIPDVFDQCN